MSKFDAQKAYGDSQIKSQAQNYFKRLADGKVKKATEEEVKEAETALATFQKLPEADKVAFGQAFFKGKEHKDFGFLKELTDKMTATKVVNRATKENMMTRIFC